VGLWGWAYCGGLIAGVFIAGGLVRSSLPDAANNKKYIVLGLVFYKIE
jgi:hypothetical protein